MRHDQWAPIPALYRELRQGLASAAMGETDRDIQRRPRQVPGLDHGDPGSAQPAPNGLVCGRTGQYQRIRAVR